jgi:hypothetical protein
MAQEQPPVTFEDIPLAQARAMGRGPRMDPELYQALKEKIASLTDTAARLTLPEDISPAAMKKPHPPGGRGAQHPCDRETRLRMSFTSGRDLAMRSWTSGASR